MPTERVTFQIEELDCADEVLQLRSALEKRPGIISLGFDVLNGRMWVVYDRQQTSIEIISGNIAGTGMHARQWTRDTGREDEKTAWQRHGRLILTGAAGALLATGVVLHVFLTGDWRAAFDIAPRGAIGSIPAVPVVCYAFSIVLGGWFVAPRAWSSLIHLRADMNLLMCVAVIGAMVLGQWMEAAVVTFLFAVALMLEHWSLGRARRAIATLLSDSPQQARCLDANGSVTEKHVDQVVPGELLLVRPSEKIPLDGIVREGRSMVNQAPITGESEPVARGVGDEVFAGTINEDGAIHVEVTRGSHDTALARIIHMVQEAQASRAPTEQWVESFARYYTPSMMALALAIAVIPPLLFSASWTDWIYNALVLLVIACPCALVISTPVTIVSALTAAARGGVLVKGGRFLEAAAHLRVMAIDKTGTLTLGRPAVQEVIPFAEHTRELVLANAAAMETHSTHPIAQAILQRAADEGVAVPPVDNYRVLGGQGAEATIAGRPFWIGSHRLWTSRAADSGPAAEVARQLEDAGHSVVAVGNADHVCGLIGIADAVRDAAPRTVAALHAAGIRQVIMLTGDNDMAARKVAQQAGVDRYEAELLPENKVQAVEAMRKQFGSVAMVGDGVNDAPALAASNLGIAMGAIGTDAAIETADVALMSDDLSRLPWLIRHGARALRVVQQNVAFALGLKLLFVGLALAGIASLWMAIAADTGASLLVIFNGMRLLKTE